MWGSTKIYSAILLVLILIIGICIGIIIANRVMYPPAYPGSGDWNGDGVINVQDLFSAIDTLINGPKYPEIVYE